MNVWTVASFGQASCFLVVLSSIVTCCAFPLAAEEQADAYGDARTTMVDADLSGNGIGNERLLKAMRTIPRHRFCLPEDQKHAYADQSLPIGHKRKLASPYVTAGLIELLDPRPNDRILELGTGSGYQAAILSQLATDVYSVESIEELGKASASLLKELKCKNVHTRIGDTLEGWPEAAPFDRILFTSCSGTVPAALIDQLRERGKVVVDAVCGNEELFHLFEKQHGRLVALKVWSPFSIANADNLKQHRDEKQSPNKSEIENGDFELSEDGKATGWYFQRQAALAEDREAPNNHVLTFENKEPGRHAQAIQEVAIDGRAVVSLRLSVRAKGLEIHNSSSADKPSMVIRFYDAHQRPITVEPSAILGPWRGTFGWETYTCVSSVPKTTRKALVVISMGGATGRLTVDDAQLSASAP